MRKGKQRETPERIKGSMIGLVDTKALQQNLESLGFTTTLAIPEMGQEIGRQRTRS